MRKLANRDHDQNPVKLAILDSGLHFHPDIAALYSDRCETYCFLENAAYPTEYEGDEDGHGTHMASIVLGQADKCKVYTGRICKRRRDISNRRSSQALKKRIAKVVTKVHPCQDANTNIWHDFRQ